MNTTPNTITQATVTLRPVCGHVFAKVVAGDGTVRANFATAETQGFIGRLDRRLREAGIVRDGYDTEMTARAYIME